MMLSLLCIFNGGNELSLSKCALTTAWGWPNLRSSVLSASLYITPPYANSATAVLALPVTRVFKYVNLTSSVKDCESMALLNCPNHSCHCKGSPLYYDNFHSGSGSFFLQWLRPPTALSNPRSPNKEPKVWDAAGHPNTTGSERSSIRWRNDRSDKGGGLWKN